MESVKLISVLEQGKLVHSYEAKKHKIYDNIVKFMKEDRYTFDELFVENYEGTLQGSHGIIKVKDFQQILYE